MINISLFVNERIHRTESSSTISSPKIHEMEIDDEIPKKKLRKK